HAAGGRVRARRGRRRAGVGLEGAVPVEVPLIVGDRAVRVARGRGVVGHGLAREGRVGRGREGGDRRADGERDGQGSVGRRAVVVGHAQLGRDGAGGRVGLRRGRVRAGVGLKGAVPVEVPFVVRDRAVRVVRG